MKTLWSVLIIMVCAQGYLQGQGVQDVDSLICSLESSRDTIKIKTLLNLGDRLKFDNPTRALGFLLESLEESVLTGYKEGEAQSYNLIGIIHGIQGNYPKSLDSFLKSLKLFEEINDQEGIIKALGNIANIYTIDKREDEAISHLQKVLEISANLDVKLELNALNSLGLAYTDFERYDEASQYLCRMMELAEKNGQLNWLAMAYNQLGRTYNLSGEHHYALEYYSNALHLNQKLGRKRGEAIATNNIGGVYKKMKEYTKALYFFKKSLLLRKEIGYEYGFIICALDIAEVYQSLSRYGDAIEYATLGLEQARSLGIREFVRDALHLLAEVYSSQKDFKKAFEYQQLLIVERDSIFNKEKTEALAKMQSQFDLERKEQQIESQQALILWLREKEITDRHLRYSLISVGLLLLLLAAFIYSRYKVKQKAAKVLKAKNTEVESKNREIQHANEEIKVMNGQLEEKMLRAQMDPHFIFNSLSSIQHFITTNDKYSALGYLSKFSKLIRQVLENSVNQEVPIADEIKLLECYVQLESLRFDHKFDCAIDVDKSLDIYDDQIPFLLIQPYVENSIVHGLRHLEGKGKLNVVLKKQDTHIRCTIQDNGIGRERARVLKEGRNNTYISRAMPITAKRLDLLNRDKKNKTQVSVVDLFDENHNAKGTKVEIQIPIEV